MKLSVVITTKNESANIANCIRAFDEFKDVVEILVIDNASTDDTKALAESLGALVFDKGPERSAQRNLGWQKAASDWVVILDADMILPPRRSAKSCRSPNFPTFQLSNLPTLQRRTGSPKSAPAPAFASRRGISSARSMTEPASMPYGCFGSRFWRRRADTTNG